MTRLELSLAVASGLLAALACVGWLSGVPHPASEAQWRQANVVDAGLTPAESIDASAHVVSSTDPFRLDRRPASVAYRPDLDGVALPPRAPKPQLIIEGMVSGAVLLDGIPGHVATTIVHAGDTLGGLRIRRVAKDTVVVSDADTIWRLTLRHTWQ